MRLSVQGPSLTHQWQGISVKLEKNVRFAAARALTMAAREAAGDVTKALPGIFDRPNSFTSRAIAALPANTMALVSSVLVKDQQAEYLSYQEEGGDRHPMPGRPVVLPVNQRTNQFGNIPRGAIGKAKDSPNTFVAKGAGRTKHLAPGIYERKANRKAKGLGSNRGTKATTARGRQKTRLQLLVSFKARVTYKPKFDFRDRVAKSARQSIAGHMRKSLADAIRTMRP